MRKKVYHKAKKPNCVAKEYLMEHRVEIAFDEAKASAIDYSTIIASFFFSTLLKKETTLSDEQIIRMTTLFDKYVATTTHEFDSINDTIKKYIEENSDITMDEILKLNPKLAGYIDAE